MRGVHDFSRPTYTIENSVLIGIAIIIGITIIGNCYTWGRIIVNIIISPRRRIQKIANKINSLSGMEPVMQVTNEEISNKQSFSIASSILERTLFQRIVDVCRT